MDTYMHIHTVDGQYSAPPVRGINLTDFIISRMTWTRCATRRCCLLSYHPATSWCWQDTLPSLLTRRVSLPAPLGFNVVNFYFVDCLCLLGFSTCYLQTRSTYSLAAADGHDFTLANIKCRGGRRFCRECWTYCCCVNTVSPTKWCRILSINSLP